MGGVDKAALLGAVLCSVVGCAGFLAFRERAAKADAAVDRSHDLRDRLEIVFRSCLNAEAAQRGYLITGREKYLARFRDRGIDAARAHIDDLHAAAPEYADELARLAREVEDKFDELEQTVSLVRVGEKPRAYTVVESDHGERSMERIRGVINDLLARETRALHEKRSAAAVASRRAVSTALGCMVLSAVLGGLSVLGAPSVRHRPDDAHGVSEADGPDHDGGAGGERGGHPHDEDGRG